MKRLVGWAWRSEVITSWAAFAANAGSFFLLSPLVMTQLAPADVALYFLFQSVVTIANLADFGFSPTFVRYLAFAKAGRDPRLQDCERDGKETCVQAGPNWNAVGSVAAVMRVVYMRISVLTAILGVFIAPLLFAKPISQSSNPVDGWIALGVVLISAVFGIYRRACYAYLCGTGYVALVNRWQAILGSLGLLSAVGVLMAGGGLLCLVCVVQGWELLNAVRNRWLMEYVDGGNYRKFIRKNCEVHLLRRIWSKAWRTGLGAALLVGFPQSFGFVLVNITDSATAASFMFGAKVIDGAKRFSYAAFNGRLPRMAALRAIQDVKSLSTTVRRSIELTQWAFVITVLCIFVAGNGIFGIMHTRVPFPSAVLFGVLALKEMLITNMYMWVQIYHLTDRIILHHICGLMVAMQTIACAALLPLLGVIALPLGSIIGGALPQILARKWAANELQRDATRLSLSSALQIGILVAIALSGLAMMTKRPIL